MDTGLVRMISVKCCIFKSCNTDDNNIVSFSVNIGVILLQVRVNSLLCLGKLLEFMDKWYVLDEILPILQNVKSREPAVLMSILGMTLHLVYIHIITFIIYVAMVTLTHGNTQVTYRKSCITSRSYYYSSV